MHSYMVPSLGVIFAIVGVILTYFIFKKSDKIKDIAPITLLIFSAVQLVYFYKLYNEKTSI